MTFKGLKGKQEEKIGLISFLSKCFGTWNQFNVSQTKDDSPIDKPNAFNCSTKARYVIAQTMLRVWSASGRRGPESADWSHLACWVMSRTHHLLVLWLIPSNDYIRRWRLTIKDECTLLSLILSVLCFLWLVLNLRYMFNCPFSIMVTFLKCQQWFQPQPFVYFWMLQHQERHANNALHYTNNLSPQKIAPSFKLFRTKRTKTIKHCFW